MKINTYLLRQWLGFTRRERRASLILTIVIVVVVCIRFLIPNSNASVNYILIEKELAKNDTVKSVSTATATRPITPPPTSNTQSRTPAPTTRLVIVDINRCDSIDLLPLPGIGPVLSGRIIRFRNLLGGYASTEQLQEVYGLSPETYNMIKDRVTADTTLIDKINVNTADFRRFSRLPYFERQEINDMLRYRNTNGQISNINELIDNSILTEEKAAKVKPYLSFSNNKAE
jgi:DNA uptake protein ComE-like DNA-binding protein